MLSDGLMAMALETPLLSDPSCLAASQKAEVVAADVGTCVAADDECFELEPHAASKTLAQPIATAIFFIVVLPDVLEIGSTPVSDGDRGSAGRLARSFSTV
jgi:hypothetical protein